MKNRALVAAIVLGPLALLVFFWCQPQLIRTQRPAASPPDEQKAIVGVLATQSSNTVALIHSNFADIPTAAQGRSQGAADSFTRPAGPVAPLEFTNVAPDTVIQNAGRAIRKFGTMFGGNPVGTNPEITQQLSGQNPKRINFLSAEAGLRVNVNGELIDPWGTPFFFHQLSGREMEIHSAGPDRVLWTADDLVTK
jgi:hypothetical protein